MLQLLNSMSPSASLVSEVVDAASEQGDPLHDKSLLHELFYKQSVRTSVTTPDAAHPN
jgi:hypothetical protein